MRIRITQTVEVDPDKWALEYGIDTSEVRQDVQDYFAQSCQQQVISLGLQPDETD